MKLFYIYILLFVPGITLLAQSHMRDTVKLHEVLVTGVKLPDKEKSAVPMQTITRLELDRISGNTVADAIKNFSGITLKDYGGIGGLKTVIVRSLGANHTGVFIDGVPMSDVGTGQIDLGKISTENADEVSLVIGQTATICQSARYYASASIINIQSMEPDFQNNRFQIKTGIKAGSFGLLNPFISTQYKLGQKTYTDFSCNYTKAKGDYPYHAQPGSSNDSINYRHNSDIESANLNLSLVSILADSSKFIFKLYYYGSQRGLPGVTFYNPYATQRLWNRDFFSNIQIKNNIRKKLQLLTNIKFSQNWLRYLDPDYLNTAGKLDNHYLQREYYLSQAFTWKPNDSIYLSLATDFFINTLQANLYQYANPTRYSSLTSIAIHYQIKRLETNGNILATFVREKTSIGESAKPRNVFTPSVSIGYRLTNNPSIRLRLMYKEIFRLPTFNDLYYTLIGNNDLSPEYARQFNAGITFNHHSNFIELFTLKADVFNNQVTDKIVAVPTKNLFVWSMRNIGKVYIKGLEIQAQLQIKTLRNFRYSIGCNYTYQKATDVTKKSSATYNQQIPYIPFETLSALTSIDYKSVSINYNTLFSGYRYILGENIYANMLPSWWVSDLSILCNIKIKNYRTKIKGEINNLYNKQYEVIGSFPMPGRSFSISITILY